MKKNQPDQLLRVPSIEEIQDSHGKLDERASVYCDPMGTFYVSTRIDSGEWMPFAYEPDHNREVVRKSFESLVEVSGRCLAGHVELELISADDLDSNQSEAISFKYQPTSDRLRRLAGPKSLLPSISREDILLRSVSELWDQCMEHSVDSYIAARDEKPAPDELVVPDWICRLGEFVAANPAEDSGGDSRDINHQTEPPENLEESANNIIRANNPVLFLGGYKETNPSVKALVEKLFLERAKRDGEQRTDNAVARDLTNETDPKNSPKADSLMARIRTLKREGKVSLS